MKIDLRGRRKVTGTLSPRFAELPDLRVLNLGDTRVRGDVAALKNLSELRYLDLANTLVSGDIAALKNLKKLEELNLRDTHVIGDMSALRATSLEVDIDGTKITCREEAALRAVLLKLGLQAEQLTDLMDFRGVKRMLSCRNMKGRVWFFAHDLADQTRSFLSWPEWPRSYSVGSRR